MKTKNIATFFAILAAALYAINIPLSKVLLNYVQPTMMAAFLYLGAGIGLFLDGKATKEQGEQLKALLREALCQMQKLQVTTVLLCGILRGNIPPGGM